MLSKLTMNTCVQGLLMATVRCQLPPGRISSRSVACPAAGQRQHAIRVAINIKAKRKAKEIKNSNTLAVLFN